MIKEMKMFHQLIFCPWFYFFIKLLQLLQAIKEQTTLQLHYYIFMKLLHSINFIKGNLPKKNRGYNEFGTKGGGVSDLNHYSKQL